MPTSPSSHLFTNESFAASNALISLMKKGALSYQAADIENGHTFYWPKSLERVNH
jgi:hypothetical protein